MEGKLAEIAYPKTHLTPSRPIVRNFVEPRRADKLITLLSKLYDLGLTPSQGGAFHAQIHRVKISNLRHNQVLSLQHNAAQFYS